MKRISIFNDAYKTKYGSMNIVEHGIKDLFIQKYNCEVVIYKPFNYHKIKFRILKIIIKYLLSPIKVFYLNFKQINDLFFLDQGCSFYKFFYFKKSSILIHDLIPHLINIGKFENQNKKNYLLYKIILLSLKLHNDYFFISNTTFNDFKYLTKKKVNKKIIYPLFHIDNGHKYSDNSKIKNYIKKVTIITSNAWYKNDHEIVDIIKSINNQKIEINIISLHFNEMINNLKKFNNVNLYFEITEGEKIDILKKSHFLIFNSIYEGFGLPIIEGLKFNNIILARESNHLKNIYNNKIIYFSIKELNKLKDNFNELIESDDLFIQHMNNSKKTYEYILSEYNKQIKDHFNKFLK